ncbi:MAG: bacillithiol biosynthesis deacetylase BshB1 [Gemmatimonadaceae bacterium]|jgi:bacillithiol biosynthesis deacetylase BshB1|nr:bacillithiol biosynthesis deacetylase BshB1 [Gemmatimonadaceae bacterium]
MSSIDVLAFAPHPDDAELLCGGTLAKLAREGRRTAIIDLTRGEMGTRGSVEIRAAEAAKAAEVLGVSVRENLGLPDSRLENTPTTRAQLVSVLRRLRPQVVIAPAPRGRHPDHRVASQLVRDACFLSGIRKMDLGRDPHRPRKLLHAITYREDHVKPTFVVDISADFETKLRAILCYESQFEGVIQAGEVYPNGEPLADIIRHQSAHYGSLIRCAYGEPFWTQETMKVDDVLALEGFTF